MLLNISSEDLSFSSFRRTFGPNLIFDERLENANLGPKENLKTFVRSVNKVLSFITPTKPLPRSYPLQYGVVFVCVGCKMFYLQTLNKTCGLSKRS